MTEHVDEWTEKKSILLICSNQKAESSVLLFNNQKVVFYDGEARANLGDFMAWKYRIGGSETHRLRFFWNRDEIPERLKDESHFPRILYGIANNESIRFRLRPFSDPSVGRINSLRDCTNGYEAANFFAPLVEGLAHQ